MKLKNCKSKKYRRGSILGAVLVIGLCLALLGFGMLKMGFGARVNSAISVSSITAREAADAGIAKALCQMNLNFPAEPPIPIGTEFPGTLDNSNASYIYRIDPHPNGENYIITSKGFSDRDQRVVYAITDLVSDIHFGIIVSETLTLNQGTLIDGYDSVIGYDKDNPLFVRIGTNSIAENAIDLKNNVVITGDVLVGVGGDPDMVIKGLNTSPGPSMNARYAMREPYEWVVKTPPIGLPPGEPIIYVADPLFPLYPQGVFTVKQSGVYDSITIGQGQLLRVESNTVPKQPITLIVNGDLNLGQSAELRIVGTPFVPETWTPVTVFLGGNLNGANSNGINNETWKPINFYLYGTGNDQSWTIKNNTDFYGVYNGKFADIDIRAKGAIYGSVAGRNFELKTAEGGPPDPGVYFGVHYDVDLAEYAGTDIGYDIKRWWEEKLE